VSNKGNQPRAEINDSEEHKKSLRRSWASSGPVAKLTVIFAGIAALSTGVYTVFAMGQWRIMHDTLALERPWVAASGHTVRTLGPAQPPEGKPIDWTNNHLIGVQVHVVNGGRTPATKLRWHMLFKIGDTYDAANETATTKLPTDLVCDQGELGPEFGAGIMLPSPEHYANFPVYVSPEIFKKLDPNVYVNKVGLYIVGCIDYSDSSGKPWYRTNVRFAFSPYEQNPIAVTRYGNEAW
jgi:hypothetical protein